MTGEEKKALAIFTIFILFMALVFVTLSGAFRSAKDNPDYIPQVVPNEADRQYVMRSFSPDGSILFFTKDDRMIPFTFISGTVQMQNSTKWSCTGCFSMTDDIGTRIMSDKVINVTTNRVRWTRWELMFPRFIRR